MVSDNHCQVARAWQGASPCPSTQLWNVFCPSSGELGMRAQRLIAGAAFAPPVVRAMEQAFDQAWAEIAGNFGDSASEIESARLSLARAMLSVATEVSTDVATLKTRALEMMALSYRARSTC